MQEASKKNPSRSLKEEWEKSSKQELFAAIDKYKNLKFDIFRVGPDDYIMEHGTLFNSPAGTHYWVDKNGVVVGFFDKFVSQRVDKIDDVNFNFNVGRVEYKLYIMMG